MPFAGKLQSRILLPHMGVAPITTLHLPDAIQQKTVNFISDLVLSSSFTLLVIVGQLAAYHFFMNIVMVFARNKCALQLLENQYGEPSLHQAA